MDMHLLSNKRFLIVSFIILSVVSRTYACDICGCNVGNYYIGLVPNFKSKFIGLRYQYRSFNTSIAPEKTEFSNDYFQTIELWGGINLGRKWQLLSFLPYSLNRQVTDDGTTRSNGLGDVAIIANYALLQLPSLSKNNKTLYQQLWIGGGIKLPTGSSKIDPSVEDVVALANSQLGSGSTDFLINAAYTIRIEDLGFSSNMNYKINTHNRESYRFGNRLASNTFLFYSIKKNKTTVTPNVGLLYENSGINHLKGSPVEQTGGYATFGSLGVETNVGNFNFGLNFQQPFAQRSAFGQTKTNTRLMAHVTISF